MAACSTSCSYRRRCYCYRQTISVLHWGIGSVKYLQCGHRSSSLPVWHPISNDINMIRWQKHTHTDVTPLVASKGQVLPVRHITYKHAYRCIKAVRLSMSDKCLWSRGIMKCKIIKIVLAVIVVVWIDVASPDDKLKTTKHQTTGRFRCVCRLDENFRYWIRCVLMSFNESLIVLQYTVLRDSGKYCRSIFIHTLLQQETTVVLRCPLK